MTALDASRFEVEIREEKTGQTITREWRRAELEQSVAWLKRMNAKGNDIAIRPAGEHALVLLDGLNREAVERMKQEGFRPAATVETGPGAYQAWVKLSDGPVPAEVRSIAAQGLAKHYCGDAAGAGGRGYGRAAGFTNQNPEYARDDLQPYVLARDCPGTVAAAAPAYLERITRGLEAARAEKERRARLSAIDAAGAARQTDDPVREYRRQALLLLTKYGDKADLTRMDWMIATDMAKSGNWTREEVEKGVREASPAVDGRKAGHGGDYAGRTAEKAWSDPEVRQHRREQEQERQMRRGRGMSR